MGERRPAGLTVSSVMVANGVPPRILALLDPLSDLCEALLASQAAAVTVLRPRPAATGGDLRRPGPCARGACSGRRLRPTQPGVRSRTGRRPGPASGWRIRAGRLSLSGLATCVLEVPWSPSREAGLIPKTTADVRHGRAGRSSASGEGRTARITWISRSPRVGRVRADRDTVTAAQASARSTAVRMAGHCAKRRRSRAAASPAAPRSIRPEIRPGHERVAGADGVDDDGRQRREVLDRPGCQHDHLGAALGDGADRGRSQPTRPSTWSAVPCRTASGRPPRRPSPHRRA